MGKILNVLIADDERTIREGICNYVPWDQLGLNVIGCVKNGEEALKIISEQTVDILISDIKMPKISGLDLVERCVQMGKRPAVIIISGYRDFGYASQAIKLGIVCDYILKPINPANLILQLKKITSQILDESTRFSLHALEDHELNRWTAGGTLKSPDLYELLKLPILSGDHVSAHSLFAEVWEDLIKLNVPLAFSQRYCISFMLSLSNLMAKNQMNSSELFLKKDPLHAISQFTTMANLQAYMERTIDQACKAFALRMQQEYSALIAASVQLIRTHFEEKNFSLQWLSEKLGVSPAYLSSKFKEETGVNFVRYLNIIKINRAKELLADPKYKVYEVSGLVNYEDYRYFSRLFKELTGVTPLEYRNQLHP